MAVSALTLLAFMFFLNMLQSCIKDQMEREEQATQTPQVVVMGGRQKAQETEQGIKENVRKQNHRRNDSVGQADDEEDDDDDEEENTSNIIRKSEQMKKIINKSDLDSEGSSSTTTTAKTPYKKNWINISKYWS